MALIRDFIQASRQRYTTHQEIDAEYLCFQKDGKRLIQIDTFGRTTREQPGKLSQTIQLDKESGFKLYQILKNHFDFV
ncbi:MAG TPA: methionyl-tRNA formyltransferase [Pseudolabrys sp.]|nr:methionyl-tRNA formyltransferase [Pseudolabrys sp.]